HAYILAFDTLQRLAEHDLRRVYHPAREDVFGALGLHGLPVLDEAVGHLSAEQDCIARVGDLDDAPNRSLIEVARHPVELSLRAGYEPIDGHLHLQLEPPHRHKECPGGWSTYASNRLSRNRHGGTASRAGLHGRRRCCRSTLRSDGILSGGRQLPTRRAARSR